MTILSIPESSIRVAIDRGGTFTDVHASVLDPSGGRREFVIKLLSQDPGNYADAPTEGIRRVLERVTGTSIPRGEPLPIKHLDYVRLSTTVATNALLERKGQDHALVITKGFRDLLEIGNQTRPRIFDLNIKRALPLYSKVVEVDERVTLGKRRVWAEAQARLMPQPIVQGLSGEAVKVLQAPDEVALRADLQAVYNEGYRAVAVCLAHSYTYPQHELVVGRIAAEVGFENVSLSSQLLPVIKMTTRGQSTTADAYLTPILKEYLRGFYRGFEGGADGGLRVEFMGSDGGLVELKHFSGLKSILSGPAGGVVGYALTSWDEEEKAPIIGFDVGGTSTDVSRFAGRYESVAETTTAGIAINVPQLDINTVAAGGGSCLTYKNGLFRAGPESAGAHPGPACYRKGGPLALTDGNLFLGRLVPQYFPKCFGPNEDEALDPTASERQFAALAEKIRAHTGTEKDMDELVYGFVKIANVTMARPIRTLTEARGFKTSDHVLASFGGAGGQHACEISELLGISRVLIHKFSSVLSAYGLSLADRVYELQEPAADVYSASADTLSARLDGLGERVRAVLRAAGFDDAKIRLERLLNMRFDGSDTALMVLAPDGDYAAAFMRAHMDEFGFLLDKEIVVDDIKVRGIGMSYESLGRSALAEVRTLRRTPPPKADLAQEVYVWHGEAGKRVNAPVYELESLATGNAVPGPALVIDDTQTIFVNVGWTALVTTNHLMLVRE
ncbi:uncharacterized protein COLE_04593 [Cutaneotrichosporon oleaginosum]|uniref:uncharacterized protein n=1 Tax=Cutaneotrichosporon oleaginosum TaxID=879819 RepID=UPI0013255457|nr:hypothetical protein COLE_04593 [Cutaneotrichosporon oleaginosum]